MMYFLGFLIFFFMGVGIASVICYIIKYVKVKKAMAKLNNIKNSISKRMV